MTLSMRQLTLRAHGFYIAFAGVAALFAWDIPGSFFGTGPQARILGDSPYAGIGFVEAHGLAIILGVLLWRATPLRSWHVVGLAIGVLLGASNLAFWQLFIIGDVLVAGYVTTALHWAFAALHMAALASAREASPRLA
jgi:hypothetical protein